MNSLVNAASFVGIRYDIFGHSLEFQTLQPQLLRHVLTNPTLFWCKQDILVIPVKSSIYVQVRSTVPEAVLVVKCIALGTKTMKNSSKYHTEFTVVKKDFRFRAVQCLLITKNTSAINTTFATNISKYKFIVTVN